MKKHFVLALIIFASLALRSQTIHWLDFNKEVFTLAAQQHKLVILDLGATWCHWCHVMDDSTYSNKAVIDYLSQHFICTKANQDKRPDLHSKYKEYGWPATVIFDGDANERLKYAGYANPREFLALLKQTVEGRGGEAAKAAKHLSADGRWSDSTKRFIENDFHEFLDYDKGGFDMSQKFIDYDGFEYMLLHYKEDVLYKDWLKTTIHNSGNINDKVWGGVYQYSTGHNWYYPHFEKLLSIQARYLKIYSKYYLVFKDPQALSMAKDIVRYLDRFLKTTTSLYYNSQDADVKEGEHSGEYYASSDRQRLAIGIPRRDTSCYLKENAQLSESFIYLWAATGNAAYLQRSGAILQQLKRDYNIQGFGYVHDKKLRDAIALGDYEYLCRALMAYYTATGEAWSKQEANSLGAEIIKNFESDEGFLNYRSDSNPLRPNAMLAENIDLCRIFNRLYYLSGDAQYKTAAAQIFSYLVSEKVLQSIIAESGILTVKEELDREPVKIVVFLNPRKEESWKQALAEIWRSPSDYFIIERIVGDAVPEKYKDMKEAAGTSNCAFICSSTSCSSPFFNAQELGAFLRNKAGR